MKKAVSLILMLVMLVGMMPMTAFATEEEGSVCGHTYENGICTGCGAENPNPYEGKTIACVGDSITDAIGVIKNENDYVTLLAKSLGMEYIRLGVSGTTLCTGGHRPCNLKRLTEANLAGADVVTILMGINDFDQAREGYYALGTIDSTDTSTIYGAVHMWCQRIEELRKTESLADTEFYFLTPVITAWNNSVPGKGGWDQSKTTIHGYTLRDLCNAIIEVCALYDVPVIDLNLISGIYYNSAEDNNIGIVGGDGIHPGATGHQMMAFALENALLKNNLKDDHNHIYGSWITTTYPGCYQGEQKRVCSVCSATESRYLDALDHTYENGVCTGCGDIAENGIWQVVENNKMIGAYSDLQSAIDACEVGGTIRLTANCSVTSGVKITKDITIDGGNFLVDISGCVKEFIHIGENVAVTLRDLKLDGGATGFEVDYDAVTYTNFTIPLVSGSLRDDPRANKSAIISSGTLICENVDISNRYTASVGGAMQILAGSATLTDCDFTHNYGTTKGGALYIGSNLGTRTEYPVERVTITGCTFTNNYTGHGGAIYAYNMAEMVIENSDFVGNTANGGKGGAIDLCSETTHPTTAMALGLDFMQTTIKGCRFENNWAGNDGFAIQSYDSDLYIYNSDFIGNVGVHQGSSVGTISTESFRYTDPSQRIYTLMDGCLFEGNRGPCAVYGDHNSISDLDVRNCEFRNNTGKDSFLLYAAVSNIKNCRFVGETMSAGVIDAIIIENYDIPPVLTLSDVSFTDCTTPVEILTRKYGHDAALQTYNVILQGTTNGDIAIWDNNAVSVQGNHTGSVQLAFDTERSSLTIGKAAALNGIIYAQPRNAEAPLNERFCVTVEARGEGLKYQWYFRNAGTSTWYKSSVKDNTYDDVMTTARAGREVYCVITDANGNSVTTEIAKLIRVLSEELEIVTQPTNGEAILGERYCVTVEARGEGLKYQWYFRNAGTDTWYASSVRDNTYDDVMTKTRAGREVYCVITDALGNTVTTEVVTLVRVPKEELQIVTQPTNAKAALGDNYCVTVEAKGEGLKYQWYFRNAGSNTWYRSGVTDNTYDDVMTKARADREVYCVITDALGNTVTTEIVRLIRVPKEALKLISPVTDTYAALGQYYCVTVNAQGESLKYAWYFRNAGSNTWYRSGVTDNTYDDVMTKARANREVYCVITDALGNQIVTEVVTIWLNP